MLVNAKPLFEANVKNTKAPLYRLAIRSVKVIEAIEEHVLAENYGTARETLKTMYNNEELTP